MQFRQVALLLVLLGVISAPLFVTGALADHTSDADEADTSCTTSQEVPLRLELGGGIPLPRRYSNPTDETVTFSARMNANRFFGPAHDMGVLRRVPAGMGVLTTESPVLPTTVATPVGTDRVVIDIFTDNGTVVARCDYRLTLERPADLADLIQVPIRWCVVAGSPQADGLPAGALTSPADLHDITREVNDTIWVPGAHIALIPAVMATSDPGSGLRVGIPVIADPDPEPDQEGFEGEVDTGLAGLVGSDMARDCDAKWRSFDPSIGGVIAVNILRFYRFSPEGLNAGFVFAPRRELWVSEAGDQGNDLCGHPRDLTPEDVSHQLWGVVVDPVSYETQPNIQGNPVYTLGHEFGHMLMLPHGNGLDDNHDGLEPPEETPLGDSPRRFDEYCDPLGTEEDALTPFVDCEQSASLMNYFGCRTTFTLQPLQVEQARAVAALVPGALVGIDCTGDLALNPECNEVKGG